MEGEFSARKVAWDVLEHLERRRPAIVEQPAQVAAEVDAALSPVRRSYEELDLPRGYLEALEAEVRGAVPERWRAIALPYTRSERRGHGVWRGGDPIARMLFVVVGLLAGVAIVRLPFIPIWEKWVPFALAAAAWWLPDLQVRWARRRYARQLAELADAVASAQRVLDRQVDIRELLPPSGR